MNPSLYKALFAISTWCSLTAATESFGFTMAYEPIGFGTYPAPSSGGRISLQHNKSFSTEANFVSGTADLLLAEYETKLLILRATYHKSPLTYLNFGLGLRESKASYKVETTLGEKDAMATYSSYVAEISFGNKFAWGIFTVGVDWLGFVVPFGSITDREEFPETAVVEEESNQSIVQAAGKRNSLQFVRPYIGVVF